MLTVTFNNQDYFEGMYNKHQKPFTVDNVSSLQIYGNEKKFVNGNMYIFANDSKMASARINMPLLLFCGIKKAAEKAFNDPENDYTIIINCIKSIWTVNFEKDKVLVKDIAA